MAKSSASKADSADSAKKTGLRSTKKRSRKVPQGIAHIQASFNNTVITITDLQGNTLAQASAGSEGFKGSRKSTPHAAQMAAQKVGTKMVDDFKMEQIIVYVRGPGPGRDAYKALPIKIIEIKDKTGLAHNGPRPSKKRRV